MTTHLHLVSDSTGETIGSVARACVAQFADVKPRQHIWNLIRTPRLLQPVMEGIKKNGGLVLYTFVDESLSTMLEEFCRENNVTCLSVLKPVLKGMSVHFGMAPTHMVGKQHMLDEGYFARIDAMDYAMEQDDGRGIERLEEADVVLLGVSRTSKTPTCIYLAGRGVRAANIPVVPHIPLSIDVSKLEKPLVVGLTKDADSLIAIRRNRLHLLSEKRDTSYVDPEQVHNEVRDARRFFAKIGCPVIDVSRRSIEETAAEIMMLLAEKKAAKQNNSDSETQK